METPLMELMKNEREIIYISVQTTNFIHINISIVINFQ